MIGGYTRPWQHLEGTWQPNDPPPSSSPMRSRTTRGSAVARQQHEHLSTSPRDEATDGAPRGARRRKLHFPYQFSLSSTFSLMSGSYSGPIYKTLSAADPQFGPASLALLQPNGTTRNVPNPLSTTSRSRTRRAARDSCRPRPAHVERQAGSRLHPGRAQARAWVRRVQPDQQRADQRFAGGANIVGNAELRHRGRCASQCREGSRSRRGSSSSGPPAQPASARYSSLATRNLDLPGQVSGSQGF